MSGEKPTESSSNGSVTTKDLFGSIPKPIDVDPFEGIDMEAINILRRSVEKDEEGVVFDEFNRMGGFDIADISGGTVGPVKAPHTEDLISLNGVDTDYISVKKADPSPNDVSAVNEKTPIDDRPIEKKKEAKTKTPPTPPPEKSPSKPSVFKGVGKISIPSDKAKTFVKNLVRNVKTLGKKNGAPPSTDPQDAAQSPFRQPAEGRVRIFGSKPHQGKYSSMLLKKQMKKPLHSSRPMTMPGILF